MPKLNSYESALFLARLAQRELENSKVSLELPAQLAYIRLEKACEALEGKVDMEEFERKILGNDKTTVKKQRET